jgi:hypothetical protein
VTKSERAAEGTLCGGGFKNVKQLQPILITVV